MKKVNVQIDKGYRLGNYYTKKPINIRIERLNDDEYIAAFEEAGISFSSGTATEAIRELKIELIEVYEFYKSEACLGAWPRHQLDILEKYIEKSHTKQRRLYENNRIES